MTRQSPTPDPHLPEERDDAVIGAAFRWSLAVIVLLAAAGGGLAWWLTRPLPPEAAEPTQVSLPVRRERPPIELPEIPFADVTRAAGIDWVHENGAYGDKLLPETMGGGVAFLDFNGNGHQDLLFVNSMRWPWDPRPPAEPATLRLYENDGRGGFRDVTAGSGLDVALYGMGVAVGDYDNDGLPDVFISALGENRLFRNAGGGKFVDMTAEAGLAGAGEWSTSCGWFDFDNDGHLDLFVCNYVKWSKDFDLAQNFRLTGGGRAYGRPQDFEGTYCALYRNNGNGTFTDVSAEAGIRVDNPLTGRPMAKALGVVFADVDGDGWMDVLVANDTVQDFLFLNQRDGTFVEIGQQTGIAFDQNGQARGGMGIDAARFRNDGDLGVAIGNFSNEMTALYVARDARQAGGLFFTDEAVSNGIGPVTRLELTFGIFFFDADLDGRLDLFAANGHLEQEINKVQASQHYEQPPQLLWNCGPEHETEFCPLPEAQTGSDFARRLVGRGAAYADVDGDGDLDIVIVGSGQAPRLLRNDQRTGHNWLRFRLEGTTVNRDAIGAWVEVHLPGRVLRQQVMPTRSYLSQCELPVTFGLGTAAREDVEKVVIHWPDQTVQELRDWELNRLRHVKQPALSAEGSAG